MSVGRGQRGSHGCEHHHHAGDDADDGQADVRPSLLACAQSSQVPVIIQHQMTTTYSKHQVMHRRQPAQLHVCSLVICQVILGALMKPCGMEDWQMLASPLLGSMSTSESSLSSKPTS